MKSSREFTMSVLFFLLALGSVTAQVDDQDLDKVQVSIECSESSFNISDSKIIEVRIQNLADSAIFLPEYLYHGNGEDGMTELYMEIENWNDSLDQFEAFIGLDTDVDNLKEERFFHTIEPKAVRVYRAKIDMCNPIVTTGKYRVKSRISLETPSGNYSSESDWIIFEVK